MKHNLFSIELVSERKFSFKTFLGQCEFHIYIGKKVLKETRQCELYQLSINIVPPKTPLFIEHFATSSSHLQLGSHDILTLDIDQKQETESMTPEYLPWQ